MQDNTKLLQHVCNQPLPLATPNYKVEAIIYKTCEMPLHPSLIEFGLKFLSWLQEHGKLWGALR